MCVFTITGAVIGLAGGIVSTIMGVQAAQQQEAMAKYQADVAEANARLARREGERIDLQADQQRADLQRDRLAKIGSARAGYAANGVVLGSGTVLDYEADVAQTYDLDLANLNYDVANQKWQKQVQALNYQAQANASRAEASALKAQRPLLITGGVFSSLGSAMQAASAGATLDEKIGKLN